MVHTTHFFQKRLQPVLWMLLPILLGSAVGLLTWVINDWPLKWVLVAILATIVPTVVLLVRDIHKLLLVAFVVDIPLGIDIALQDQEWHIGGPTGYMISMMTFVIIVGYALWILERKPEVQFFPMISVPALIYLGMVVFSLYQSINLQLSLFGIFFEVQFFLGFFYMANHIREWDDLRLVMSTIAVFLLLESILILLQYFFNLSWDLGFMRSADYLGSAGVSGARVGGTIGTPNSAGAYLAATILLTLGAYASGKLVNGPLALAAIGLGMIALILTMTRTAWAGVALGMLIISYWFLQTPAGKRSIPILMATSLLAMVFMGAQIWQRVKALETDNTRSELAYMAYRIIDTYPMGVGVNNFDQAMSDRYAHPNWVGHTLYPVHNKYLLVWSETGLQGLAAFALMLILVGWQSRQYLIKKDIDPCMAVIPASLLVALIGYAIHMSTEGFSSRANLQLLWLIIALIPAVNGIITRSITGANDPKKTAIKPV